MLPVLFMIGNAFKPEQPEMPVADGAGGGQRLSELLGSKRPEGYAIARSPRAFTFPRDHGPHPEFRNEWWYLTGNLEDDSGRRFGYEFTLFRFSLTPEPPEPSVSSSWKTNQVYIAHFAVTEKENRKFHVEQRAARGALGLAGAQSIPFRVWIEDWSIAEDEKNVQSSGSPERWQLRVAADELGLQLDLHAEKPIVLNGVDGLSQKSDTIGNASYYYSIPRLRSTGQLQVGGENYTVTGTSWLDREWSSSALDDDQQGWDWFALQLSDGSDLMFYNLRKYDGSQDRHSAGTWIDKGGKAWHLDREEVMVRETANWESPRGGTYPAGWELRVPSLDLDLTISPVIPDQELVTTVRYWEGAVDVEGSRGGHSISGRGYVELTGYARSR
ncbi:lipocalin-like domain-containing protein [Pseudomonadota bacterium]